MRVVVEVADQEQAGGDYGGNHASAVQPDSLLANQHSSRGDEYRARAIQAGIERREDVEVYCHNQAAGSVLRRLTIRNPAKNTTAVKAVRTAMEGANAKVVAGWVSGKRTSCRASRP